MLAGADPRPTNPGRTLVAALGKTMVGAIGLETNHWKRKILGAGTIGRPTRRAQVGIPTTKAAGILQGGIRGAGTLLEAAMITSGTTQLAVKMEVVGLGMRPRR